MKKNDLQVLSGMELFRLCPTTELMGSNGQERKIVHFRSEYTFVYIRLDFVRKRTEP
jgi:hypothetical protein